MRWLGLAVIAAGGLRKSSLTYWIFFAMLAGGEIGFDRPHAAEHLRILSDIFLRLITVFVAPLILATLITGIGSTSFRIAVTPIATTTAAGSSDFAIRVAERRLNKFPKLVAGFNRSSLNRSASP